MLLNKDTDLSLTIIKQFQTFLFEKYGYDFRDYALSSFKRRVEHLLFFFKSGSVSDLIRKIDANPSLAEQAVKEITVNTTEMFRDPSFWRKMRDEVLPQFASSPVIRIWHAACSSGEEVYSMCIILQEMGLLDKTRIFASDINSEVLANAKSGIYPVRSLDTTKSNFDRLGASGKLESYYKVSPDQTTIRYNESLIKNVNFRKHNLASEEGFSKFDIILCRNVMIYFNFDLQDRVMDTISNSLFKGGYLAIGSKETIVWCSAAKDFQPQSAEEKIYKKIV